MALAAVDAQGYGQERLTALGRRQGFPVVVLSPPFSHAAAAETVAQTLCASPAGDAPGGTP